MRPFPSVAICTNCGSEFAPTKPFKREDGPRSCSRKCSGAIASKARSEEFDRTIQERFWAKVDRSKGLDSCWPWQGSIRHGRGGYGRFPIRMRYHAAHRLALEYTSGPAPADDLFCCHRCDNPPCCNPAHLFWGTASDNNRALPADRATAASQSNPQAVSSIAGIPSAVFQTDRVTSAIERMGEALAKLSYRLHKADFICELRDPVTDANYAAYEAVGKAWDKLTAEIARVDRIAARGGDNG